MHVRVQFLTRSINLSAFRGRNFSNVRNLCDLQPIKIVNEYKPIDLRSDTVTTPSAAMRAAMAQAEVGDDVYGEDPTVNLLQRRMQKLFDKEAALFFPSGTQSNLVAVGAHCERGDEVILGNQSHIFWYEGGGSSSIHGVAFHTVPNLVDGDFSLQAVKDAIREDNCHYPSTSLVCVESTHNKTGGRVLKPAFLQNLREIIDEHNNRVKQSNSGGGKKDIKIHMDGARIFNACLYLGMPVDIYTQHVDTISVCLSKGLGAPVGSVLLGPKAFINKAIRLRKALGGGMRQAGILAAAGLYALDHHTGDVLRNDHRRTQTLLTGLRQIKDLRLPSAEHVETNILFFDVVGKCGTSAGKLLADALRVKHNILVGSYGDTRIRVVCHLNISDADIQRTIAAIKSTCEELFQ